MTEPVQVASGSTECYLSPMAVPSGVVKIRLRKTTFLFDNQQMYKGDVPHNSTMRSRLEKELGPTDINWRRYRRSKMTLIC
jgi:hypothetical protein